MAALVSPNTEPSPDVPLAPKEVSIGTPSLDTMSSEETATAPPSTESRDKSVSDFQFKAPSISIAVKRPQLGESANLTDDGRTPVQDDNKLVSSSKPVEDKTSTPSKPPQIPTENIPYTEPTWASVCPHPYALDVLKNGTIVGQVPLEETSCRVFGRLPACHVCLLHPSLSRFHAVLQYSSGKEDRFAPGWYLYDLDSTHGTVVNKNRLPPLRYIRVRVGHVIKFAGSTRLHVLTGPSEDQDDESSLSWTDLKVRKHQKEVELDQVEEVGNSLAATGCSWGMSEDAVEEGVHEENPFALLETPQHEDQYSADPGRVLRHHFEKDSGEPPQFEFLEEQYGKHHCRLQLPMDNGDGTAVYAEAITTGKKKEAVRACSLEACRMLDMAGLLFPSSTGGPGLETEQEKRRQRLADNDYYDSDEDTFLDRTGQIENKRHVRMRIAGKVKQEVDNFHTLTAKLKEVEEEMDTINSQLNQARQDLAVESNVSELDELDAYMTAIKNGAMDRKTRMRLKARVFQLRKDAARLQKLVNISRPSEIDIPKPPTPTDSGKRLSGSIKLTPLQKVFHKKHEESDDEEKDRMKTLETPSEDSVSVTDGSQIKEAALVSTSENAQPKIAITTKTNSGKAANQSEIDTLTDSQSDSKTSSKSTLLTDQSEKPATSSQSTVSVDRRPGPQLPSTWKTDEQDNNCDLKEPVSNTEVPKVTSNKPERKRRQRPPQTNKQNKKQAKLINDDEGDQYDLNDPDYAVWVPPQDQAGDGKTRLNDKFGY